MRLWRSTPSVLTLASCCALLGGLSAVADVAGGLKVRGRMIVARTNVVYLGGYAKAAVVADFAVVLVSF